MIKHTFMDKVMDAVYDCALWIGDNPKGFIFTLALGWAVGIIMGMEIK